MVFSLSSLLLPPLSGSSHKNDLFLLHIEVLRYSEKLYEGSSADFINSGPVLLQILAARPSEIMSELFYTSVKLCNLFYNYSEYKSKKKTCHLSNYCTGKCKFLETFVESIGNDVMSNIYPSLADKVFCEVRNAARAVENSSYHIIHPSFLQEGEKKCAPHYLRVLRAKWSLVLLWEQIILPFL